MVTGFRWSPAVVRGHSWTCKHKLRAAIVAGVTFVKVLDQCLSGDEVLLSPLQQQLPVEGCGIESHPAEHQGHGVGCRVYGCLLFTPTDLGGQLHAFAPGFLDAL